MDLIIPDNEIEYIVLLAADENGRMRIYAEPSQTSLCVMMIIYFRVGPRSSVFVSGLIAFANLKLLQFRNSGYPLNTLRIRELLWEYALFSLRIKRLAQHHA